jgi:HlyD family secretion protein
VIALAPSSGADGGRVDRLLVAVGDRVVAGQVVAILDPYTRRVAAVRQAQAQVEVARAKLAQTQAGPKPEDLRAQEALIERDQAELQAAERDLGRAALLFKKAASSRQDFDDQNLKYEQARESLNQARAQLAAMRAIRPVDVEVARAELNQAEAGLEVAGADLRAAEVRSPIAGRVLRIHTQPGERAGDKGILDVGNIDVMHVVAEVYEEDVSKVRIGQAARVRVPSLGEELSGQVVRKDLVVGRKVIFNNDPVADTDARVIEVRIRLAMEDSPRVAGLSNARAEVVIDVNGGAR